jgi:ABC-type microcin C transport system duplicated ATPase subunit YejF
MTGAAPDASFPPSRQRTHLPLSVRLPVHTKVLDGDSRIRELRASRMAMIFQEPMTALNPVLTVGRQIREVLESLPCKRLCPGHRIRPNGPAFR